MFWYMWVMGLVAGYFFGYAHATRTARKKIEAFSEKIGANIAEFEALLAKRRAIGTVEDVVCKELAIRRTMN